MCGRMHAGTRANAIPGTGTAASWGRRRHAGQAKYEHGIDECSSIFKQEHV